MNQKKNPKMKLNCPNCGAELRPVRLSSLIESMYIDFPTEETPNDLVLESHCDDCGYTYEHRYRPASGKENPSFDLLCSIEFNNNLVQGVEYTELAKKLKNQQ